MFPSIRPKHTPETRNTAGHAIIVKMADIPQWRRKIPPSRSRTPMLDFHNTEQETRPPSALAGTASRPPTPKKGLRPKLSSYLSQSGPFGSLHKADPEPEPVLAEHRAPAFPSWVLEDPYPAPGAEQLTDAIMCRLMSRPYDALEPRFNGTLLQIFEAHRQMADEKNRLQDKLAEEMRDRLAERSAMQQSEQKWEDEKKTYKAEVKRLELVIAKGKRGVAEVALVRQDSLIRRRNQMASPDDGGEDDGKETVFEFLEKTKRFEDPSWSGQRATMKSRPASPSAKMAKLSRKLTKKTSKTSILAELPFGSPPPNLPSPSLLQASYLEETNLTEKIGAEKQQQSNADIRVSFSDDTTSTFSCAGDFLPDEGSEKGLRESSEQLGTVVDNEMAEIRKMAVTISRRRGVSAESIIPRLLDLFHRPSPIENPSVPCDDRLQLQRVVTAPAAKTTYAVPTRRPSHIMGFINKLRPQLSLETTSEARRFSFEVGDDTGPIGPTCQYTTRESPLRKSASLSALPVVGHRGPAATAPVDISPIESSPTTSARTASSRRTSRIPSPRYNAPLAKQRQEREDSITSLPTVMKDPDLSPMPAHQVSSATSSLYSTRSLHSTATDDATTTSRTAPQAVSRVVARLDADRIPSSAAVSLNDAAGHRNLVDYTNAVYASTSKAGGNSIIRGSVDASNAPSRMIDSSMRGTSGEPPGLVYPEGLRSPIAASENTRPFVHPGHHG
ncbi:hypothetical protein Q7P37_006831 [Cladosporium fusiforme]